MFPEIPVGGCFKYFLKELKLITQGNRVLSVLKEGHKREFIQKQKFWGVKKTSVSHVHSIVLLKEVKKNSEKETIEPVFRVPFSLFPQSAGT